MNKKVLGRLSRGLSRSRSPCSVSPESVRSKHISLPLHTHPNQAHPFSLIKIKESLRFKRPQVRNLPSAPQTARVLRAVGGFSFCPRMMAFPLCRPRNEGCRALAGTSPGSLPVQGRLFRPFDPHPDEQIVGGPVAFLLHKQDASARTADITHAVRMDVCVQGLQILRRNVQSIVGDNAGSDKVAARLEMGVVRERKRKGMHILFQRARPNADGIGRIALRAEQILKGDGDGDIGEGKVLNPFAERFAALVGPLHANRADRPCAGAVKLLDPAQQAHAAAGIGLRLLKAVKLQLQVADAVVERVLAQRQPIAVVVHAAVVEEVLRLRQGDIHAAHLLRHEDAEHVVKPIVGVSVLADLGMQKPHLPVMADGVGGDAKPARELSDGVFHN